jgi:hypothetical protein
VYDYQCFYCGRKIRAYCKVHQHVRACQRRVLCAPHVGRPQACHRPIPAGPEPPNAPGVGGHGNVGTRCYCPEKEEVMRDVMRTPEATVETPGGAPGLRTVARPAPGTWQGNVLAFAGCYAREDTARRGMREETRQPPEGALTGTGRVTT